MYIFIHKYSHIDLNKLNYRREVKHKTLAFKGLEL